MYPTYPSGPSGGNPAMVRVRPDRPPGVKAAVVLMYVSAALIAILTALVVVFINALKKDLNPANTSLTQAQLTRGENHVIASFVVFGVVSVALWIWMAWANGAGKNWARILSTVLFGLFTAFMVLLAVEPHGAASLAPFIVIWLLGLVTIVLLWRKASAPYFDPQ
jgi:Na+/alanine symporter